MNISKFPTVCTLALCELFPKGSKRIAETVEILLIKQSERRISVIFQRYARLPFENCFLKEASESLKPLKFY